MNNMEIKSCPFCGKEATVQEKACGHSSNGNFTATYHVGCTDCKVNFVRNSVFHLEKGVPVFEHNGYEEAVEL